MSEADDLWAKIDAAMDAPRPNLMYVRKITDQLGREYYPHDVNYVIGLPYAQKYKEATGHWPPRGVFVTKHGPPIVEGAPSPDFPRNRAERRHGRSS